MTYMTSKKVDELKLDDPNVGLINKYKRRVEVDATEICKEVLSILEQHLIPSSESTPEAFVLYTALKGDVHRYLTEFKTGPDRQAVVADAIKAYEGMVWMIYLLEFHSKLGLDMLKYMLQQFTQVADWQP